MLEGRLSDMDSPEAAFATGMQIPPQSVNLLGATEIPGGIECHPVVTESECQPIQD